MKVRVLSAVAMSAGDASRLAASARPSPPPYQPLSLSLLSALFFWNSRRRNHEQNGGERGGVLKGVVGGVGWGGHKILRLTNDLPDTLRLGHDALGGVYLDGGDCAG
jgi:hypothetical protein